MTQPTQCLPTELPPHECSITPIFGVPKGMPGRGTVTVPVAIALHCINNTYAGYLVRACSGALKGVDCQASMHFVLDGATAQVSTLVPVGNIAWAFQSYKGNFPSTYPTQGCVCPNPCAPNPCPEPPVQVTYPGWPTLAAQFPNLSADFYTINIGLTVPKRAEQLALDGVDCCPGPFGLNALAYASLVQVLAYLAETYDIPIDAQHIAFHDSILNVAEGCEQCSCSNDGRCLLCDVSSYCRLCENPPHPSIGVITDPTQVKYVLVETLSGCLAKIRPEDLGV